MPDPWDERFFLPTFWLMFMVNVGKYNQSHGSHGFFVTKKEVKKEEVGERNGWHGCFWDEKCVKLISFIVSTGLLQLYYFYKFSLVVIG